MNSLIDEAIQMIIAWLQEPANTARLQQGKQLPIGRLASGQNLFIARTGNEELRVRAGTSFKYVGRWTRDLTRQSGGGRWWVDESQARINLRSLLN